MNALVRALHAETLKLRGTLALWLCLIAPAVVVLLYVLQMAFSNHADRPPMPPARAWLLYSQSALVLWALLMLPLFVTLQSALLAGLEHGSQQWKHLLSLPMPRSAHYLAKTLALAAMVTLATLSLIVLVPLGGALLAAVQPKFGIGGPAPWTFLVTRSLAVAGAAMLIVALHTWASIRWRSFTVAVSIGITATVAGFLIGQSARFGKFYPWSLPLQVYANDGQSLPWVVSIGLAGGALATIAGMLSFSRRDVD